MDIPSTRYANPVKQKRDSTAVSPITPAQHTVSIPKTPALCPPAITHTKSFENSQYTDNIVFNLQEELAIAKGELSFHANLSTQKSKLLCECTPTWKSCKVESSFLETIVIFNISMHGEDIRMKICSGNNTYSVEYIRTGNKLKNEDIEKDLRAFINNNYLLPQIRNLDTMDIENSSNYNTHLQYKIPPQFSTCTVHNIQYFYTLTLCITPTDSSKQPFKMEVSNRNTSSNKELVMIQHNSRASDFSQSDIKSSLLTCLHNNGLIYCKPQLLCSRINTPTTEPSVKNAKNPDITNTTTAESTLEENQKSHSNTADVSAQDKRDSVQDVDSLENLADDFDQLSAQEQSTALTSKKHLDTEATKTACTSKCMC